MSSLVESFLLVQALRAHVDRLYELLGDDGWWNFVDASGPLLKELIYAEDDHRVYELINQIYELLLHSPAEELVRALLGQAIDAAKDIDSTKQSVRVADPTSEQRQDVQVIVPFEKGVPAVSRHDILRAFSDIRGAKLTIASAVAPDENDTPQVGPPKRYFATRIEGGPEAKGTSPQLLVGKKYDCVFGVKAEADPRGIAVEIPPEDLAKMRDREVQVLAGGEGLEIRNSCVSLKIHQDYTSAEAAINFNAVNPGPCNLQLFLLLDRNVVRTLRYDFMAVQDLGRIAEAPPAEQGCNWPTPEECQRLRKQELLISVSGGLEELMLHFVWGAASAEPLPLKEAVRRELEGKKQNFLSNYARSMRHTATARLRPDATREFLEDLNKLGEEIFRTLFILPARRGLRETGEQFRDSLRSAHPAPIQIIPGQEHLPWMFLSDGEGALGLRHGVEYILSGTLGLGVALDLTRKPLRLVCGLAPLFKSQKLEDGRSVLDPQRETLQRLSLNRFNVSLAWNETKWLQDLRDAPDVIYAYCHGSSGNGDPCLWMTDRAKAISGGTIDSSPEIDWSRNPLVILAACTSGAIDPFRATGLANSFMARGARGYIAADGQVPAPFASLFMTGLFEEFFKKGGKPVGEVLVNLRRRFLEEMNNPWGILFTQFCRSEITVAND
jgi:CHAT domain